MPFTRSLKRAGAAQASNLRCAGAQAISDLLMWLATYFDTSAEHQGIQAGAPLPSAAPSVAAGSPASAQAGAAAQPARAQRRIHKNDVLACASAVSGKHVSFDIETNGVLPALWRPYRIPSEVLRKACAERSLLQSTSFPCHLVEVEPEMQ